MKENFNKISEYLFKEYPDCVNVAELQKMLGLPVNPDVPIVAMITRLVSHKGLDLVEYVMEDIMQRNLQFVVIGTGDKKYEEHESYIYCPRM